MSKSALAGTKTESFDSAFEAESKAIPLCPVIDGAKDYFVERDGIRFAGMHLLVELWEAEGLDDPKVIEDILCRAAEAAEATVLHSHMHHFSPYGGVSGVIVLAESHISIHTWPERAFAAIDIFMCGTCDPHKALPLISGYFKPGDLQLSEHRRGVIR
jgi:S-adenosylmethionine decarboxylase